LLAFDSYFREVVENFTLLARGLAMELLRLLCEGLGLPLNYFEGDLSGGYVTLDINQYPPCPNPSVTLGLPPHCDRDLIALLLPARVPGLEVAYKGDWIKVKPVPRAFVVNFGQQLEVVTNGVLKSVEHRVMTNSALARTSVAMFIAPTEDCVIGPAEEFLGEENPPCYRTLRFRDFKRIYNVVKLGSSINLRTNLRNIQKEDMI
jgi:2'-deoxymugineic-acid 2'-dioxygenase/mugineic-acid 3-dioxygenase